MSGSQCYLMSDKLREAIQVWLGLQRVKHDLELGLQRQRNINEDHNPIKATVSEDRRMSLITSTFDTKNIVESPADDASVKFKDPDKLESSPSESHIEENVITNNKDAQIAKLKQYVKMALLITCWVFFTIVFILYKEKDEITRQTYVAPGEIKSHQIKMMCDAKSVQLTLTGPFVSEHVQRHMKSNELAKGNVLVVWLERLILKAGSEELKADESNVEKKEVSNKWSVLLVPEQNLDLNKGETRSGSLDLSPYSPSTGVSTAYVIRMKTTSSHMVPLTIRYKTDPVDVASGVLYSCLLLGGLYTLIILEIINRTMAAIIVATTSLAVLALIGERPSLAELVSWLDMETLLLLFSMMVLVAIASETGVFDFLAVFTFEVTRGSVWPMMTLLCALTGLLSTFLDNVTTVMLMTPVTIRLCKVMNLHPVPVLTSMVLFSNIGGTATPVGDPPNVIIASNKAVVQSGINFTNFTLHMMPGILLVCVQTYYQLRYLYRDTSILLLDVPREIQDLRHQISICRRTMETLSLVGKEQQAARDHLEEKVTELNVKLAAMEKESIKTVFPDEIFRSTLAELKHKYKIRDMALFIKCSIAISFVVLVFFLHSFPQLNRVSLGWTALLGAILLLTLIDRQDIEPILHRVEWSTLLFFASLFVLMEALSKLGLITFIGIHTEAIIMWMPKVARSAVALLLVLWVSGVTSAFVDNIPLTTMMVRVVTSMASNTQLGLPMAPLIWALSFGACLGGNGTLIGASANVVCAGVAEQHGYRFTFLQFFKIGFPIMIGHLVTTSLYLFVCHCIFSWH